MVGEGKGFIAAMAAASALGGAIIGGAVTYVTTEKVLEGNQKAVQRQIDREDRQQRRTARGAAGGYAEQLDRAQKTIAYAEQIGRVPDTSHLSDVALPALEDRRLILSRLSSTSARTVVTADEAMRAMSSIIQVNAERPLRPDVRR